MLRKEWDARERHTCTGFASKCTTNAVHGGLDAGKQADRAAATVGDVEGSCPPLAVPVAPPRRASTAAQDRAVPSDQTWGLD